MTATAVMVGFQVGATTPLELEISTGKEPAGPQPQVLTLLHPGLLAPAAARLSGCLLENPRAKGVEGGELLTTGFHPETVINLVWDRTWATVLC